MDFDVSPILDKWDFVPGQVVVRRFTGRDGRQKIQLRLDLGLLQMNAHARPDGKRPCGHPSLLEFFHARLKQHRAQHGGSDEGFRLKPEDCGRLQLEAIQYPHRCICLLQLEDYPAALRDTARNLRLLEFVGRYAESEELAWAIEHLRPQLLLFETRARASQSLKQGDHREAIRQVEAGIERIRQFFQEHGRSDALEHSAEIQTLEEWQEELRRDRPLSRREKLELDLNEALKREDYETAARVRDKLRSLDPAD